MGDTWKDYSYSPDIPMRVMRVIPGQQNINYQYEDSTSMFSIISLGTYYIQYTFYCI